MKLFGKELKFNGFDIWHKGNFDPNTKSNTSHMHENAAIADTRSTNYTPQDKNRGVYFDFKANSTDGLNDGGIYHFIWTIRQWGSSTDWSGGSAKQIALTDNGNIWIRCGVETTWGTWTKIAKSSDIPTKLSQLTNDIGAGGGTNIIASPTEPPNIKAGDWWFKEL